MSTGLIVILGVLAVFVAFIVISQRRMKNLPDVKNSENVKTLSNKNFKAITAKGLVLVDFWAAWCGPCKMMGPVINDVADEAGDQATVAKLNVDHNQELAQRYKVRSIPTLILFKDGKEINRYVGVKQKKFLLQEIAKYQ
jgi:thioredoxin 1